MLHEEVPDAGQIVEGEDGGEIDDALAHVCHLSACRAILHMIGGDLAGQAADKGDWILARVHCPEQIELEGDEAIAPLLAPFGLDAPAMVGGDRR